MCKSGSPSGEPLLFLSIYSKVTKVFHSDYIVLLAKAVSAAIYYVEWIGLLCLSGIVRPDDFILCAVNDENRAQKDLISPMGSMSITSLT